MAGGVNAIGMLQGKVDSSNNLVVTIDSSSTGIVTSLVAGTNITLTPSSGVGAVTIDAAGGGSGITIGTTTITSGTTTRILYDNAGVVGEYTLTGSGTVVMMQTAPTFVTSMTGPLLIGGTGTTSTLTLQSTSGVGAANEGILFKVGNNGATTAGQVMHSSGWQFGTAVTSDPGQGWWAFGGASTTAVIQLHNSTMGHGSSNGWFVEISGANVEYDLASTGYHFWSTGAGFTERMRLTNAGGLNIGATGDPGVGQINALNGYRVGSGTGTAGATFGPGAVTSITVVGGIITAIS